MNREKVAILVDSGCDVPQNLREQHDIRVLPLKILYPEGEYLDQVTITAQQVYSRFPETPKTSLPDGETILHALDQAKADGYEKALVVCISSGLSGTYSLIRTVCGEYEGMETFVLDTKNISIGSGMLALLAARWLEQGMSWSALLDELPKQIKNSKVFFCVDTLEYLRKGGRLGLVAAVMGTALKLKPIISCNEDGVYYIAGKTLGRKQSIDRLLKMAAAFAGNTDPCGLAVMNGAAPEEAHALRAPLEKMVPLGRVLAEGQISPALVVHTGPGLLGIGVLKR
jgi:DegV family protein with EDD domain